MQDDVCGPLGNMNSQFIRRNVTISGRRTSLRLESAIWNAFEELCRREKTNFPEVCDLVERHRDQASRTSALRIFIINYFLMVSMNHPAALSGVQSDGLDVETILNYAAILA